MESVNASVDQPMGGENGAGQQDDFDCSFGPYGVFAVVPVFQFINWIIKSIGPPKSLRDDEWKWRNLTISYIHAIACVVLSFTSLWMQPSLLWDLQHGKSFILVCVVTLTTGYFLYDFLDIILNGKMMAFWEVQLHHVAVWVMFFYNLVICEWLPFNLIGLMVEVNSALLHQRKLLQMVGEPYSSLRYRVTIILNIITFVIFRGGPVLAIVVGMVVWYDQLSLLYFLLLCGSMFFMVVMHPILFMRLLRSDFLRSTSGKSEKRHAGKVEVNGNNNHINGLSRSRLKQN